jgi:hypothetical protein
MFFYAFFFKNYSGNSAMLQGFLLQKDLKVTDLLNIIQI